MWIVVKFNSTDEVEVVPLIWYNKESSTLLYPNLCKPSQIIRAIKNQQAPDEDWNKFQVVLMRNGQQFDNFYTASKKAEKACLTSDISDAELLSSKRIPKKKVIYSSSEEIDDSSGLSEPPPTPPPSSAPKENLQFKKKQITEVKEQERSQITRKVLKKHPNASMSQDPVFETVDEEEPKSSNTADQDDPDTKFKKTVLVFLNKLSKQIGALELKVISIGQKIDQQIECQIEKNITQEDIQVLYSSLPVKSEEQLRELESKLVSDQIAYTFLMESLQKIGGINFKEATRRISKQFMSDKVAIKYSLKGHKAKRSFIGLKCCDLILDAVQKSTKHDNRKEIEMALGIYLSKAGERLKKSTEGIVATDDDEAMSA